MNICKAKDSKLSLTSVRWVETNQSRTCQVQFEIKKTKVLDWLSQSANLTQHHLMILLNKRKTFWSLNVLTLPLKNCTTILKGKTNHPDFLNQPVLYQDLTMLLWICNNLKQRSFLIKSSISYKKMSPMPMNLGPVQHRYFKKGLLSVSNKTPRVHPWPNPFRTQFTFQNKFKNKTP